MMWNTLIVLCAIVAIKGDEEDWLVLKTPQGPVRGRKNPAGVHIFSNIPYATVPKGSHKFTEPLPPPAWLQPLQTPEKGIICPQELGGIIDPQTKIMQEECLIANVYVPITEDKKLPVLVYIHGGAFEFGFGDLLTPKNFVNETKVIVVTFNYRLGVHGFLCLGTDLVPGNAGLKDQVALLRWVQKNIASYGGNPEDVTVAGYSAGAVSADLLMLSKSTKGLFQKVILESGVSTASIAIQADPLQKAKTYAKSLNFTDVNDVYALQQFYINTPLESLVTKSFYDRKDGSILFGPCVERKSNTAFLDESPVAILEKGDYRKVSLLLGISSMEGLLMIQKFQDWKRDMNEKFSDFLPADLDFENEDQKDETAKAVKEFYFGDQPVSENTIISYINYFSDILFSYSTVRISRKHAENGNEQVYLYQYSFVDNDTAVVPHTNIRGAEHCAQTQTILDSAGPASLSEEYKMMKATMRELWRNFVVHGKPVPEGSSLPPWPAVGAYRSPYMSLEQTLKVRGFLIETRALFWDEIYQKYYRHPISPPRPPHTEL